MLFFGCLVQRSIEQDLMNKLKIAFHFYREDLYKSNDECPRLAKAIKHPIKVKKYPSRTIS